MPARPTTRRAGGTNAGRVIAGSARGIRLVGPGERTRPLADRVKQTLFAILEPQLRDRPFLDLYAGSGAAGIEALSRGAASAVFVDADRSAIDAIERNLGLTGLAGNAQVAKRRVVDWLSTAPEPFGAIVLDPPYDDEPELARALEAIVHAGRDGVLAGDGVAVAKHFWRADVPTRIWLLTSVRQERFGETMLTFYRWEDEAR